MSDLILTNGDVAADLLAGAGKRGTIVPWRDMLHEGPVTADLDACTLGRVSYLARRYRIDEAELSAAFHDRDATLKDHAQFEHVELWFEHDLYDQLQLLQILAALSVTGRSDGVSLVQAGTFLGLESADTILRFADRARAIEAADLDLAAHAWEAVAAPTPEAALALFLDDTSRLPYLLPALRRFFEELPAPGSGLGRTERAAILGIAEGTRDAGDLFRQVLAGEEAAFMGDLSFYGILDDLAFCEVPLIHGLDRPGDEITDRFATADLQLTMAGEDVVAGEDDHVALSGIDRWWGGTHLAGRDPWRFDPARRRLLPPGGTAA
ncbi:MAG: DUF1835 domain-containing protein [Rhizobiales bacterium]|nr:DUF1835 domain-containing protein [Hyphomicrobiales bacterium]